MWSWQWAQSAIERWRGSEQSWTVFPRSASALYPCADFNYRYRHRVDLHQGVKVNDQNLTDHSHMLRLCTSVSV